MLDYRIETFMTLFRERNYRRTAELLGMTQPGVTQHIHFLEDQYGVKLFHYDGRQLSCTRQAELLKQHIDSVRAKERALRQSFTAAEGLHLDIGATKTIGEFVLPGALENFLSDSAHTLGLVIDNTQRLLELLEQNRLDFAIIEGVFDKAKYGYHLYKKETFLGICSKTHPFSGKKVTLEECFQQNLLLREQGSGTRKILEQAMQDRGFRLEQFRRCTSVSNFSVILELLAKGDSITFGYAPIAAKDPQLSTFQVEDMQIVGEFNFVYCDAQTAQAKISQFFSGYGQKSP